jgi:hypothetical protein
MVVTSRPLGYEPLPGCDALYEVLPLQPEDARAFVDRWFLALAEARGVPEGEREAWAGERARWLREQLDTRSGLREVAENPLMLTFLAVLAGDEPRQDFPRYRKDLYARYVERLFTAWEASRRGGEEVPLLDGFQDANEAREVALWGFRRVALHLHRAYAEKPAQASCPAVKAALADELARTAGLGRFQAPAQAGAILAFWERAGLLDGYRLGDWEWLAFRHLTFQEYGAARALAEAYQDDPDGLWAELEPHILDDDWAQVIPLALAHLEDPTPLLERLLEANAQDEDRQRPLFLAAATLSDGASGTEAQHRQMVDSLENLIRTRDDSKRERRVGDFDAITAMSNLGGESYAQSRLLVLAHDSTVRLGARLCAVMALGRLSQIDALLALARNDEMGTAIRLRAGEALGKLGQADSLLALAHDGATDPWTRREAAKVLGLLGWTDDAASILLALARDTAILPQVCSLAVSALDFLYRADELSALAHDSQVSLWVRLQAVEALGHQGRTIARSKALDGLWAVAEDRATPEEVRQAARRALQRLEGQKE